MNPQQISTSFLIATGHIRAMRGGAQSHMLTANDGNAYVVKFANNPQSLRVVANEWLAGWPRDRTHNSRTGHSLRAFPARGEFAVTSYPAFQFDAEMFARHGIWLAFHFRGRGF